MRWSRSHLMAAFLALPAGALAAVHGLQAVLDATMAHSPAIQLSKWDLVQADSGVQETAGAFDLNVDLQGSLGREEDPLAPEDRLLQDAPFVDQRRNLDLALAKAFGIGMVVRTSLELVQATDPLVPRQYNQSALGLGVTLPLLQGAWWGRPSQLLTASEQDAKAARLGYEWTVSEAVVQVVNAYWDCLAAEMHRARLQEELAVALDMQDSVKAFVEADDMPAFQLNTASSEVESAKAALYQALASAGSAKMRLASLVGVSQSAFVDAEQPGDLLPDVAKDQVLDKERLFKDFSRKPVSELRPVKLQKCILDGARVRMEIARNRMLPDLKLDWTGGVRGRVYGESTDAFFGSANQNRTDLNHLATLSLSLPLTNRSARARADIMEAKHGSEAIRLDALLRDLEADRQLAMAQANNAVEAVKACNASAQHASVALKGELLKMKKGASTLMAVLKAKSTLADASIAAIEARRNYANAISGLRRSTDMVLAGSGSPQAKESFSSLQGYLSAGASGTEDRP